MLCDATNCLLLNCVFQMTAAEIKIKRRNAIYGVFFEQRNKIKKSRRTLDDEASHRNYCASG